jgi:hypothetical protein
MMQSQRVTRLSAAGFMPVPPQIVHVVVWVVAIRPP